jgi:hypothetical protein
MDRVAKVIGKFANMYSQMASELEHIADEESAAILSKYKLQEGEGITNAVNTWLDFLEQIQITGEKMKTSSKSAEQLSYKLQSTVNNQENALVPREILCRRV